MGIHPESKGRPTEAQNMTGFEHACQWLEKEIETHSVTEFAARVKEFSGNESSYTNVHIKRLLEKKYCQFFLGSVI